MENQVRPGDILVTRNTDEVGNESPGYWNHCAIVIDGNWVVEATQVLNGVIAVPIWNFFNRYPEVLVLRSVYDLSDETKLGIINKAKELIGRPYDRYGSVGVTWRHRNGDNCVSLVRRAYLASGLVDPGWIKPDSLVMSINTLKTVAHKKDYENYKEPTEKYAGAIKVAPNSSAKK